MASSRKSKSGNDPAAPAAAVEAVLRDHVVRGQRVCLALSGGVDSAVLLDVLARLRRPLGFRLSALHVHHGLSPNAGRWAAFCARICRARRVPLAVEKVAVRRARGESPEAAARQARYAVLWRQDADWVLLAHNRDDQAETLLLQLLRGAGVEGLAAMPVVRNADLGSRSSPGGGDRSRTAQSALRNPRLLRPLLAVPRGEIEAYARARRLRWVEDESNLDSRFERNFLRLKILPQLERRYPGCRAALARASRHLGEAGRLLEDLAAADALEAVEDGALRVAALRELGAARARNLLRHWLRQRGAMMPPEASLAEALRQAAGARSDAGVDVALGDFRLRVHRGLAYLEPADAAPATLELEWRGEPTLELPGGLGRVAFRRRRGKGLSLAALMRQPAVLRLRGGGEKLRAQAGRPRRTLKNLLQEAGVPPWQRARMPLLFCGGRLAWAPGIGADADFRCAPGEPGVVPEWEPVPR
ncbi:MAG TPA: tRNA lysidine(34) synthetase TilS [Burkholderiales bacterium]|nr:tRNA lysidine(34) synthetase TilS [Burkholderiales bacterium]